MAPVAVLTGTNYLSWRSSLPWTTRMLTSSILPAYEMQKINWLLDVELCTVRSSTWPHLHERDGNTANTESQVPWAVSQFMNARTCRKIMARANLPTAGGLQLSMWRPWRDSRRQARRNYQGGSEGGVDRCLPIICGRILKPTMAVLYGCPSTGVRKKINRGGDWLSHIMPAAVTLRQECITGREKIYFHRAQSLFWFRFGLALCRRMIPLSTRLQSTWNRSESSYTFYKH